MRYYTFGVLCLPGSELTLCSMAKACTARPIVVVDDNPQHLEFLSALLCRAGYVVRHFRSARKALEDVARSNAALVITDVFMPDVDGVELLRSLARDFPGIPVIAVGGTGRAAALQCLDAMRVLGAVAAFEKPIDPTALLAVVGRIFEGEAARRAADANARCRSAEPQAQPADRHDPASA